MRLILYLAVLMIAYSSNGCLSLKNKNVSKECLDGLLIKIGDNPSLIVGDDLLERQRATRNHNGKYGVFTWTENQPTTNLDDSIAFIEITSFRLDTENKVNQVVYSIMHANPEPNFEDFLDFALKRYMEHFSCIPNFEKAFTNKKAMQVIRYNNLDITIDKYNIKQIYVTIKPRL